MTPQETLDRAHQAEQLLGNVTLQKAFEGVRQALLVRLEECAIGDHAIQHEITVSLQLLKQLKRQLSNWVSDGQLEKARATQRKR